ncbi:MAG: hypothetical protein ABSG40_20535 [Terriglobales bacterium]|jgi:hypothetical protein
MELQNRIIGVVGRKGSGKSAKAREIMGSCPRLLVFDSMAEHDFVPNTFTDLDELDQFLAWATLRPTFAGRFIPQGDLEQEFCELASMIYDQGNMMLAIEEVPMLTRSPAYLPPEFDRLVRLGRHHCVSLLWTAQRMAEVARRLTAATDYFVLFSHTEPRDLDAIADRCGDEIAEQVSRLPLHGLLAWDAKDRRVLEPGEISSLGLMRVASPECTHGTI